jgi:hypothetical protein
MLRIGIRGGFMLFGARDWGKQIKGITDGRLPGYDYAKLNQCLPVARVTAGERRRRFWASVQLENAHRRSQQLVRMGQLVSFLAIKSVPCPPTGRRSCRTAQPIARSIPAIRAILAGAEHRWDDWES